MRELRFRELARQVIDKIWRYSRKTYPLASAENYYNGLLDKIESLQSDILLARRFKGSIDLSYVKYGSHFIYFRATPTVVQIVRVLHERRDQAKFLS